MFISVIILHEISLHRWWRGEGGERWLKWHKLEERWGTTRGLGWSGSLQVVRLLWALSDHSPGLLHPPLDVPGGDLVFPRGHLGVLTGGRLESLQGLVEAGPGLYGAVVARAISWVEVSFTVVGEVGPVVRRGGAIDLPAVGAVVVGAGGAGGAVVVTRGFVPKTQSKIRTKSQSHSWDKYTAECRVHRWSDRIISKWNLDILMPARAHRVIY